MTAIHRFVQECRAGTLARCLGRMPSGWAVLGDPQIRPGYCLLYPDPVVGHLNELDAEARAKFWEDLGRIGDAILAETGADRVNYEILGNQEPALHAHAIPRWANEPEAMRTKPIWLDDWAIAKPFDPESDQALQESLRRRLGL